MRFEVMRPSRFLFAARTVRADISAPLLPRDYLACRSLGSFFQIFPRWLTRQGKPKKCGGFMESLVPELIAMPDEDAQTFFRLALTSEPAREFLRKRAEETTS